MFNTLFYQPLYNGLVYLISVVPGGSVALAIILLTIVVKIIILPLYHKAAITQRNLKKIEPELAKLKEKHKDNREEQARQMLELYRANKINPFTSFFVILIQIPVVLALFFVFRGDFVFKPELLYSFVSIPEMVNTKLFGLIEITDKSFILAFLTGFTQFIQARLSLPVLPPKERGKQPSFKEDFARSMNLNLRYVLPVFIGFVAYSLSSAVALYWITSNIFSIGQELYIKKIKKV